jgi:tRNA pseudouridine55 synthase
MEEKKLSIYEEGQVLFVDKPLRWTSFDVVRRVRNLVKAKVGHAGTLDPLATGLLIICTGKFTKRINDFMAKEKEYTGTFTLGATTPTYDREGDEEDIKDITQISDEMIYAVTQQFTGEILQVPPIHSAIKQNGKRVYTLARQGKEVKMEPRKITISAFEITRIELPAIHFRVVCSTGTYIRSLANDVGAALGCGAYLGSLRRTRIGEFALQPSMNMEEVESVIRDKLATEGS